MNTNNFKFQTESINTGWADEMEDEEVISPAFASNISLPSAPKSTLGLDIDYSQIPVNGPFRINVSNLPYEVTDEQLESLFDKLSIKESRINLNEAGRPSGTAIVEFYSKNDLVEALSFNNKPISGRSVRIYLPDRDRGYGK